MDLYIVASSILENTKACQGTIKGQVLSSDFGHKKQLYAVVMETAKRLDLLKTALAESGAAEEEINSDNEYLAYVLAYEIIFRDRVPNIGHLCSHGFLNKLRSVKSEFRNRATKTPSTDVTKFPKYGRVNRLKMKRKAAKAKLVAGGYEWVEPSWDCYEDYLAALQRLTNYQFTRDYHVKNVFAFGGGGSELYQHAMVKSGQLILQDKASCLPAIALAPPKGSCMIDACAAPGGKTSHLAALLHNSGSIIAVDRDAMRLKTLRELIGRRGVKNVQIVQSDFLQITPAECPGAPVTHILLDPSCSCSGVRDLSSQMGTFDESRVRKLANFQAMLLNHALSKFPSAVRVVYSTCSKYSQENESVVREVLRNHPEWQLVKILPSIKSRGDSSVLSKSDADKVVRLSHEDLTGAFFVACFERTSK